VYHCHRDESKHPHPQRNDRLFFIYCTKLLTLL
jgi:hypothetical protein